ncbi:DUF2599 domain-containing protein [Paenarthrobacter sp. JL.01a]|uniref:DUF2599 domain-containing protein n=1 Tax=Paenarthrobacter sp. JL.01a TaxID=2979324 RepID=UPI0021C8D056|nr:DUF2599 domain-containing protein [Paenarthrobacter sp. JL.01a]UXM92853.1 DUF2599 domain-containing protein [Paenarthrobacter sp. JL.01a]
MKSRSLSSLLAAATVSISILGPTNVALAKDALEPPSHSSATTELPSNPLSALQTLTAGSSSASTEVLSDVASVPTNDVGAHAIDATVNDIRVVIPTDPVEPVSVESATGTSIKVSLPFAGEAASAKEVLSGVVAYDNDNGSTTVPVVKNDGSVQIMTVINNSEAPSAYTYRIGLPPGSSLASESDGSVSVLAPDGSRIGAFAPAWAKDAHGADVSTHYEVTGTTLVQVVDHSSANIAYPVTADPYLGIDLISSAYWSGRTFVVTPTWWARANGNSPLMHQALLSEFCSKYGSACNTQMWWQLACHAQFAPFKATWNLDSWLWRDSYYAYIANLCN